MRKLGEDWEYTEVNTVEGYGVGRLYAYHFYYSAGLEIKTQLGNCDAHYIIKIEFWTICRVGHAVAYPDLYCALI